MVCDMSFREGQPSQRELPARSAVHSYIQLTAFERCRG